MGPDSESGLSPGRPAFKGGIFVLNRAFVAERWDDS
jgi:hypothetical protein